MLIITSRLQLFVVINKSLIRLYNKVGNFKGMKVYYYILFLIFSCLHHKHGYQCEKCGAQLENSYELDEPPRYKE